MSKAILCRFCFGVEGLFHVSRRIETDRKRCPVRCGVVRHKSNERRAIVVNQATFTRMNLAVYLLSRRVTTAARRANGPPSCRRWTAKGQAKWDEWRGVRACHTADKEISLPHTADGFPGRTLVN